MKLEIIIASTRPGRIGDKIGDWVEGYSTTHSSFDVAVADLATFNLPLFNEPGHPMQAQYKHDHTKAWSKRMATADAFIIVTPEYNYTIPPALVNAIDYLHHEWKYKRLHLSDMAVLVPSRAIQTEKLMLVNLSMMPVATAVNLVGVHSGTMTTFEPSEHNNQSLDSLLSELSLWATALLPLHTLTS